mmetsp:Transcript_11552/g.19009  ORF Transcript_11552/g.19009 Transcript_11552/m.19009 type:complete len:143 (-) Transcript_11552:29-457(-)
MIISSSETQQAVSIVSVVGRVNNSIKDRAQHIHYEQLKDNHPNLTITVVGVMGGDMLIFTPLFAPGLYNSGGPAAAMGFSKLPTGVASTEICDREHGDISSPPSLRRRDVLLAIVVVLIDDKPPIPCQPVGCKLEQSTLSRR